MKRSTFHHFSFSFLISHLSLLICILLTGCGVDGDRFRVEGRFRNMNQAELLVYSMDGGINGVDTILVRNGRFSYETTLRMPSTLVIIFPNFSELPIFAKPGKTVDVKGDVSHLKEIAVGGTDANDDMTKLRMQLNKLMPPEVPKAIEEFIKDNPESQCCPYLVQHYFLQVPEPDFKKAYESVALMLKENPEDGMLVRWENELKGLRNNVGKGKLPAFSATDIKGRSVSQNDLKSKVNVLTVWASWNFVSVDTQQRLLQLKKTYGDKLSIVSICLDGDINDCKRRVNRDSVQWKTVCDGRMWQSPVLSKLGVGGLPANWVVNQQGVVIDRNLNPHQMEEKIKDLCK
jgi:hypothetical protein